MENTFKPGDFVILLSFEEISENPIAKKFGIGENYIYGIKRDFFDVNNGKKFKITYINNDTIQLYRSGLIFPFIVAKPVNQYKVELL